MGRIADDVTRPDHAALSEPSPKLSELRSRLAEAEETLRAISTGEVDAVVTIGKNGPQVFTLEGADHAYRVLIESMHEGALTLTPQMTILYANQCFANMVKCPLEQVMGSSFRRFLSAADRATLRLLLKKVAKTSSKGQMHLLVGDGSQLSVQTSLCSLPRKDANRATISMVVTDMTQARRSEELLRSFTRRIIQAQEADRRRVALDLHDHVTQLVCATLFRSHTLVDQLSNQVNDLKQTAITLREMLGQTAAEVERISRSLRPSVLDELGLTAVLRNTTKEFAERSGVCAKVTCVPLPERLPAEIELSLYRILQEALRNVRQHARAHHVAIRLTKPHDNIQLSIQDDGIGFDTENPPTRQKEQVDIGLLSMRERATYLGGTLMIKSVRQAELKPTGTVITVRIPLASSLKMK